MDKDEISENNGDVYNGCDDDCDDDTVRYKCSEVNGNQKFQYKRKEKQMNETCNVNNLKDKGKQKEMNADMERNHNCNSPPLLEKIWRVNSDTLNDIQNSANKYPLWQAVNRGDADSDDDEDIIENEMNENECIIADEIAFMERTRAAKAYYVVKENKITDKNPHDESSKKVVVAILNEYTKAAKDEVGLLKQKAKVNWMKNGDKNIVAGQFVKYFEDFLRSSKPVIPLNNDISKSTLSMEEAEDMLREVNDNEIKEALFDVDGDKAFGPDGYSSKSMGGN
nr:hypothetical protein [Tanacetum cinerariifolium]